MMLLVQHHLGSINGPDFLKCKMFRLFDHPRRAGKLPEDHIMIAGSGRIELTGWPMPRSSKVDKHGKPPKLRLIISDRLGRLNEQLILRRCRISALLMERNGTAAHRQEPFTFRLTNGEMGECRVTEATDV
jgi:hypothetical protein